MYKPELLVRGDRHINTMTGPALDAGQVNKKMVELVDGGSVINRA